MFTNKKNNMNKTIRSIALLKVLYTEKNLRDYLDIFIPFFATLIEKKDYQTIEIEQLCTDFEQEFGLGIPYHPMQSIIKRAQTKNIILRKEGKFIPNEKYVTKFSFKDSSIEMSKELDYLIKGFQDFAIQKYQKMFTDTLAENIFISFIKENEDGIIISYNDESLLPEIEIKKENKFIVRKYIKYLFDEDYNKYKLLSKVVAGFSLANCIFYNEPQNYKGSLKNIEIFLDTRIIFRLIGLEGDFRKLCYNKLLKTLVDKGARINVFIHTYDESKAILEDCIKWIGNTRYNPYLASPVLKYFVENNYDKESVKLFISKIDSYLTFNDIAKCDVPNFNIATNFQIESNKLFEIIKALYHKSNNYYEDPSKDEVIWRDVKSIEAIFKIREGKKPNYIKDSKALFITTNSSLAKANIKYLKDKNENNYPIKECLTDVFLGTVLWSESPAKFTEFQEKKIISNCIATLEPDDQLLKKLSIQIQKLEEDELLSPDELYFLKTHKIVDQLLSDKTLGDSDNYYDKLPEEILDEIKSKIKNEASEELNKEKSLHNSTKDDLDQTKKKVTDLVEKNISYEIKIDGFSKKISRILIQIFFGIALPIAIFIFAISVFPDLIETKWLKNLTLFIAICLSILSTFFGLSVKWIIRKLEFKLRNKIKKLILK